MNYMFNRNEKLEEVHLPNIDNIIQTILSLCKNLKYIDIKDNFEYIDYFFSGEGFDDIPENIVLRQKSEEHSQTNRMRNFTWM